MTRFSLFLVAVSILLGVGAAELDLSFVVVLATAVQDNAMECTLLDAMELKLRLASSFQSNGRKYFQNRVILNELEEVDDLGGSNDDRRELLARPSLAKPNDTPTQGLLRGHSKYDRELIVIKGVGWTYKGTAKCTRCNPDNSDRRKLVSDPSGFNTYMSEHMTMDIKAYIVNKSLNGDPSCLGDPDNVIADFLLLE